MMFHTMGVIKNSLTSTPVDPDLRLSHEMELIHGCDSIIVPSEREKEEIISRYGDETSRLVVAPCGVDTTLFRPLDHRSARREIGLSEDEHVLLYVGRFDPLKGLDRLLTAGSLLKQHRRFKLVVIGGDATSTPEWNRLVALTERLDIRDSVIFAGTRPQPQLPTYYVAADLLVIPSYYESFGLVGLEALACGTPVVTTDVGDYRNIIRGESAGYVVVDGRPETMAGYIDMILDRPMDKAGRVDKIRGLVRPYSWSRVSETLIEEYQRLVDSPVASLDSAFVAETLRVAGHSGPLTS
jgi:D-inositol-3-phosphate glycosyltransferase